MFSNFFFSPSSYHPSCKNFLVPVDIPGLQCSLKDKHLETESRYDLSKRSACCTMARMTMIQNSSQILSVYFMQGRSEPFSPLSLFLLVLHVADPSMELMEQTTASQRHAAKPVPSHGLVCLPPSSPSTISLKHTPTPSLILTLSIHTGCSLCPECSSRLISNPASQDPSWTLHSFSFPGIN